EPRLLHRLRRDRSVLGRGRRRGVRGLSTSGPSAPGLDQRYAVAVSLIDSANAEDPTFVEVRGERLPLALAHGRLAAEWMARLVPDADEALLLAARAHHLRRFAVP